MRLPLGTVWVLTVCGWVPRFIGWDLPRRVLSTPFLGWGLPRRDPPTHPQIPIPRKRGIGDLPVGGCPPRRARQRRQTGFAPGLLLEFHFDLGSSLSCTLTWVHLGGYGGDLLEAGLPGGFGALPD